MRLMLSTLLVYGTVLLTNSLTAVASTPPFLSPMQCLPGDNLIGPAAGDQVSPFICQGSDNYLTVWVDKRTNLVSYLPDIQTSFDIYAARVSGTGVLLDTMPIIITQKEGQQFAPRAAWNGQNWFVAWLSQEPTQFYFSNKIVGVRLSPQGEILDSSPIQISTIDFENPFDFALTSDGVGWFVAWSGNGAGTTDLRGARIAADGSVLDPGGAVLYPGSYYVLSGVDVAFAAGKYFVVWEDLSDCRGLLMSTSLQPDPANPVIFAGEGTSTPRVASNGSDFLVTFGEYVSTTYFEGIFSRTVSHTGQLGLQNQVYGIYGGTQSMNLHVVWDGVNWIANWNELGDNPLRLARIASTGSVIDMGGITIVSGTAETIAPRFGGGIAAVYSEPSSQTVMPYDIFFTTMDENLTLGSSSCISMSAPSQISAHLAEGGGHWMVTYVSLASSHSDIMAVPIDATGKPLTASPTLVATGLRLSSPSIAWDGTRFLLTWHGDVDSVYARRIAIDGTPIDESPIPVMPGFMSDVAAVNGIFLVVTSWKVGGNPEFIYPIAARLRGSDGVVLDSHPISIGNSFAKNLRVETAGDRWLAVFEQHPSHDDPAAAIVGCFIDIDGIPTGPFNVNADLYSIRDKYRPDVACSGETLLVVWQDPRVGYSDWNIHGSRVTASQNVIDYPGFPVATAPWNQTNPAITWNGADFVVAYEDQRGRNHFFDQRSDLYLTRVGLDGSIRDTSGIPFSDELAPEILPAVVSDGKVTVIAGSIYQDAAPFSAYRIGLRSMGLLTMGDCNGDGSVDVADLTGLISGLFIGFEPLPSGFAANVDCSSDGNVDIGDLTRLIDHLYIHFTPLVQCE